MLKVDESRLRELAGIKMGDVIEKDDIPFPKKLVDVEKGHSKGLPNLFEDSVMSESDTEALAHQIAGHDRIGILKHKLGYVLKPRQKEPLGSREVEFYKSVFADCKNKGEPLLQHQSLLQNLIPKFHGMTKIESKNGIDGQQVWKEYMAVDDIIEGFSYPCVTDIKIGAQTWDPFATPEKIEHEKSKYKGTKVPLGLSLTGMQHFDLKAHTTKKIDNGLGKTIDERGLVDTLEKFLNRAYDEQIPAIIAKKLVTRLKDFQEYFSVQRQLRFYSSSLLIAYDAEKFANFRKNSTSLCNGSLGDEDDVTSWLRVWMIDFAHVVPAECDKPDSNYIYGLDNLVKIFQSIASKQII